jgi:hypothetical protein
VAKHGWVRQGSLGMFLWGALMRVSAVKAGTVLFSLGLLWQSGFVGLRWHEVGYVVLWQLRLVVID